MMIKLSCKSCGGKLEITNDIDQFCCGHCGTEWIVNRRGGIVSLKAVEEKLDKINKHTEKTAEYSKVLAAEAKLRAIGPRIFCLKASYKELKKKPLYVRVRRDPAEFEERCKEGNEILLRGLKFLGIGVILFIISVCLSPYVLENSIVVLIFVFTVSPCGLILLYSLMLMFEGFDKYSASKYVPKNRDRLEEIEKEVRMLERKAVELEARLLE